MPSLRPRLTLARQDFLRTLGLVLGYVPAAVIPSRLDPWLARTVTGLALKLKPDKPRHLGERMARTLGPAGEGHDFTDHAQAQYEMLVEGSWGRARNLHRRRWNPVVSLEGLERLEKAREAGKGTILWRMTFGSGLLAKKALWEQGVPLVHLSMEQHGAWSESWVARHVLCPLWRRAEDWYLEERVVIPWERATGTVMKTLLSRLTRDNAVVSIMGENSGPQNVITPFFDAQARFAIGSPSLAWKAGSELLPVYAVREGTLRYRVVIDEPIAADRDVPRKEYVQAAVEEYSRRLQETIVRHPGSWAEWGRFWSRDSIYEDVQRGT